MSSLEIVGFTLLYAFPLALLALLLTDPTRRWRWLTTAVLAAMPLFYAGHYLLLQTMQGWPSDAPPPEAFRLLGFEIREPDVATRANGEILLWLREAAGGRARVHRLPYGEELHQALVSAGRLQAEGKPQRGTFQPTAHTATAGSPEVAQGSISFRTEQPPTLPAKE